MIRAGRAAPAIAEHRHREYFFAICSLLNSAPIFAYPIFSACSTRLAPIADPLNPPSHTRASAPASTFVERASMHGMRSDGNRQARPSGIREGRRSIRWKSRRRAQRKLLRARRCDRLKREADRSLPVPKFTFNRRGRRGRRDRREHSQRFSARSACSAVNVVIKICAAGCAAGPGRGVCEIEQPPRRDRVYSAYDDEQHRERSAASGCRSTGDRAGRENARRARRVDGGGEASRRRDAHDSRSDDCEPGGLGRDD
jgi:hypothetical protein